MNHNNRLDAIQEEDEDADEEDARAVAEEEERRLEQAYLNSKCARLVLSCVRNRCVECFLKEFAYGGAKVSADVPFLKGGHKRAT